MIRLSCLVLALLLALSVTTCSRSTAPTPPDDVGVTVSVAPEPHAVGPAVITVTLRDEAGSGIEGAGIAIKADMTHAGMTPVLATLAPATGEGDKAGVYTAPFEWTMGGDWIVTIDITLADGRSFTQKVDFRVTGSM